MTKTKKQAFVKDPNVYWMIRKKGTNLYSRGGCNTNRIWGKQGKIWPNQTRLLAHFRALDRYRKYQLQNGGKLEKHPYKDAEVVSFRRVEEVVISVEEYGK